MKTFKRANSSSAADVNSLVLGNANENGNPETSINLEENTPIFNPKEMTAKSTGDILKGYLERVYKTTADMKKLSRRKVEFTKPNVNFIYGNPEQPEYSVHPLLYAYSITLIQGGKGSYKSRFTESLISSLLCSFCVAGCKRNDDNEFFVIHIDTERSYKDSFVYAMQTVLKRANIYDDDEGNIYDDDDEGNFPDNYLPISLIQVERSYRLDLLKMIIQDALNNEKVMQKKIVIVIDISSDMISNFNDIDQTMMFIDYLNVLINDFNCSVVCVLHENPGSTIEKTRGHLGTELTNKSSVVLKLGKENDSIYLKFLHVRNNITPTNKFYFRYSDDKYGLDLIQPDQLVDSQKLKEDGIITMIHNVIKMSKYATHTINNDYEYYRLKRSKFVSEYQKKHGGGSSTLARLIKDYTNRELNDYIFYTEQSPGDKKSLDVILTNKLTDDDVLQNELYGIDNNEN